MVDASTVVCGKSVSVGVAVGVAEALIVGSVVGAIVGVAETVVTVGVAGATVGAVCPVGVHATNIERMMNKSNLCTERSFSAFLSVTNEPL